MSATHPAKSKLAQQRGKDAEASAARFLEAQGLVVLERRFAVRRGEVDLVCVDPSTHGIVFVEVRFRSRHDFGGALASVTRAKAQRLRFAASVWLQRKADARRPARIDVIGLSPGASPRHDSANAQYRWEGLNLAWVQSVC